jgi:hypothetical protein
MASQMSYSRKVISDAGDRNQLELALARELYRTWESTKTRIFTRERIEFIERRYSKGSVERVRHYMNLMKDGEME